MTLLYADDRFLDHDTGRGHPERPLRLQRIAERLSKSDVAAECPRHDWQSATRSQLELVHAPAYIEQVVSLAESGGGNLDADTPVSAASADVAMLAAGAACDAVGSVLRGEDRRALCVVRPPGHHALPDHAMGFCLFNNIAIAARVAIGEHALERVLIVDWDVHHGNGTQDIFYGDGQVGFFSAHRWPFYPGTGDTCETGTGPGLGATRNLPVSIETPRERYLEMFRRELEDFAARIQPQLVLISAGFDAHRADPVGYFLLETEDFARLTRDVCDIAGEYAGGRVVSILEGGYHPNLLAECVETHLRELNN